MLNLYQSSFLSQCHTVRHAEGQEIEVLAHESKQLLSETRCESDKSDIVRENEDFHHLFSHPDERLRLIEANVSDYAIFVIDPEGRIASWNLGARQIMGYISSEVLGKSCTEFFTEEDRASGSFEHERRTAQETGRSENEHWHIRKDGTLFRGSGTMTALRDSDDRLRGFVIILRDMTHFSNADRKQQEDPDRLAERARQAAIRDERIRFAREIHDTLGQGFTGITLQLEAAEDALQNAPDQTAAHLHRASQLARHYLAEARRSILALRPQALENNDLPAALAQYVQQVTDGTALIAAFALEGTSTPLSHDVEHDLLRIGQEALTNALKHAKATHLEIRLIFDAEKVQLEIIDNGRGFDTASFDNQVNSRSSYPGAFGLLGMRERVERMQGQIQFFSAADQGTRVVVTVPIRDITDTIDACAQDLST